MKLELKMLTSSVNQTSDENIPDVYQIFLQNQLLMQIYCISRKCQCQIQTVSGQQRPVAQFVNYILFDFCKLFSSDISIKDR